MAKIAAPPPMHGLKRRIAAHRKEKAGQVGDSFVRQTFCLEREEARKRAREWFDMFPRAAYASEVESWRQLEGDRIEFTMRRLPTAD